jgi:peptide/nickel transport system substrate-binding protein
MGMRCPPDCIDEARVNGGRRGACPFVDPCRDAGSALQFQENAVTSAHRGWIVLAGLALGVGLGCLGFGSTAVAQQRGGTLIFTVPASDFPSMDGHQEITFATVHPTAPLYSLLIRLDPTDPKGQRISGDVAENRWAVSKDKKTYTFRLHRNVKFSDGSRLTAKDVVASLEHIINPPPGVAGPRKSYYSMVESVKAEGDYTVVIKLKFATAAFIPSLSQPFNYIYPAAKLKEDPNYFKTHVLGSGPFIFKSEQRGANFVGVRNPHYFKPGLPYLDGYEAIFTPKENIELQALRGGRSMIQFRGFPPAARDELKAALGDQIVDQESIWNCGLYVIPNSFKKPFDDIRVRQALNLAIDRWGGSAFLSKVAIAKKVGAYAIPGSAMAMSDDELAQLPGYWRDAAKSKDEARRLLKEAGVPDGFKFKLNNRNTDQPYKFVATYVIDQWRQVGLNVEQVVMPTAPFYEMLAQDPPQFDTTMDFNCQSVVNPTADIQQFISKDRTDSNHGHYIDRKLDELFDAQMREPDLVKQKKIFTQFETYLNDQALQLTTLWWNRITLQSSKVQGWYITPSHYLNQQLETVWLKQ